MLLDCTNSSRFAAFQIVSPIMRSSWDTPLRFQLFWLDLDWLDRCGPSSCSRRDQGVVNTGSVRSLLELEFWGWFDWPCTVQDIRGQRKLVCTVCTFHISQVLLWGSISRVNRSGPSTGEALVCSKVSFYIFHWKPKVIEAVNLNFSTMIFFALATQRLSVLRNYLLLLIYFVLAAISCGCIVASRKGTGT